MREQIEQLRAIVDSLDGQAQKVDYRSACSIDSVARRILLAIDLLTEIDADLSCLPLSPENGSQGLESSAIGTSEVSK